MSLQKEENYELGSWGITSSKQDTRAENNYELPQEVVWFISCLLVKISNTDFTEYLLDLFSKLFQRQQQNSYNLPMQSIPGHPYFYYWSFP